MFGHVEFVLKPAPGRGIVSSAVLQSDTLDEVDWEWLGSDNQQVQSNYFGKGQTTTYNRGAFHADPNNQGSFKTYTIDWTADQIAWQIDGKTIRTLTPQTAEQGQYPQSPMMIKVGAWSGGDSSNAQGTVQWAGGPTDYSAGPYSMQVKSIAVTDYSTGTQYTYSGTDGTWQSIKSDGKINTSGKGASPVVADAPQITSSNGAPIPFEGTHRSESTYVKPDTYPWVASTLATSASTTATTYPGLPAGWTVTSSGKVLPPSAASVSEQPPLKLFPVIHTDWNVQTPSPAATPAGSPGGSSPDSGSGYEVVTTYDQRGFLVTQTTTIAQATAQKHFNDQGFLITGSAAGPATNTQAAAQAEDSATGGVAVTTRNAAAPPRTYEIPALILAALGILASLI